MSPRIYLDHNATAPLRAEVRDAMLVALQLTGNPSSVHAEGRAARAALEGAREQVARLVNAKPEEVIFTSGATEANALALAPHDHAGAAHCYVSAIEHASILSGGRFPREQVDVVPVDPEGVVDLAELARELANPHFDGARPFVSVMVANNETGALQPALQAAEITHAAGGLFHTDAVAAAGKVPVDFVSLGADLMTLSAHKLGGPKGVGAVVIREGVRIDPLFRGGAQERRLRAGTENLAGIVGFGVAAEIAAGELDRRVEIETLRDALEKGLRSAASDAVIFSSGVPRLPNTSCFAVPGTRAETLVIGLDLAGFAVSAGSACSSGKVESSHVLKAMGVAPELAEGAIRVSLGHATTREEIDRFIGAWNALIGKMRQSRAAA